MNEDGLSFSGPVLFVIDALANPHAGTEGQLLTLIRELDSCGIACHLLVLRPSRYLHTAELPCPVSVLGRSRVKSPATWWRMWVFGRRMARRGFRIAHTYMNDASVMAPPMFRLSGIHTLVSRRDLGFWYTPTYLRVLRYSQRHAAGYVGNSRAVVRVAREKEGVPEQRCHVIYNGLSVPLVHQADVPELESLRTTYDVVVGLVANLRPIKRIHDLIDAITCLSNEGRSVASVVIGAGDRSELEARARSQGVEDRIRFLGSRSDVPACLRFLDIGVLCSESEGFSNTVVEYMAAGLPTVCTDTGGNPEAVEDGVTGLLYPVGDVPALADALRRLCDNEAERRRMGQAGQRVALERYTIETMVHAHLKLYSRLVNGA